MADASASPEQQPLVVATIANIDAAPQPPPPISTSGTAIAAPSDYSAVSRGGEEENQEPPASAEGRFEAYAAEVRPSHSKKNAWTAEEDAMLARIIAEQGHGHWTKVAAHLPGRMGRQCRERWFNHLAPEVKKGDWSKEEDQLIVAAVREHGTKWSLIQKQLPGRSDNSIKNRYYSAIRKAQRLERRTSTGGTVLVLDATDGSASEGHPTPPAGNSPLTMTVAAVPGAPAPATVNGQADTAAKGIVMRHHAGAAGSPQVSPTSGKRKQRPTPTASDAAPSGGETSGAQPAAETQPAAQTQPAGSASVPVAVAQVAEAEVAKIDGGAEPQPMSIVAEAKVAELE